MIAISNWRVDMVMGMLGRFIICICLLFTAAMSAKEPELICRPQSLDEAFAYIEKLAAELPWFKKNGYRVALPEHPQFEAFYENPGTFTETDRKELKRIFAAEVYDFSLFDASLVSLYESEGKVLEGLSKLALLQKNWGFKLLDKYEAVLTLYGPGGDYKTSGLVRLFTTPMGKVGRTPFYQVLLHEMVHIGIHEKIVNKYKLSHWEKERLVDLICRHYLGDVLPEYKMQRKGDSNIDAFISKKAILNDLPSAIAKFTKQFPR